MSALALFGLEACIVTLKISQDVSLCSCGRLERFASTGNGTWVTSLGGKLRWSEIHKVHRDFRWRFYCKRSPVTISSLKQIQNSNNCSMNWQTAFCCLFACFSTEKIKSKCKVWNQPSPALRVFELSVFSRCTIEIFISWVHYAGFLINVLWH